MFCFVGRKLGRGAVRCWEGRCSVATVISGHRISQQVMERLKKEVAEMRNQLRGFRPGLVVLQVGDRDDSNVYIRMKLKAAATIGINANHIRLPKTATEDEVLRTIAMFNENPEVHGLIVQLPLDSIGPIDVATVTDAVDPEKDVDGLSSVSAGRLSRGDLRGSFTPCTPNGVMRLIRQTGVSVSGRNALVIGRSKIVGAPMHDLLLWNHATVTTCHSKTPDIAEHVSRADIVVVGVGKPQMVRGEWIKKGAVVIDVGINYIPDSSRPSGMRMVGDVHYPSAKERAGYITPVPGGVGPMTVAMLMQNTVRSARRFLDTYSSGNWNLSNRTLTSQRHEPRFQQNPIHQLAKGIGLLSTEVEPFGGGRVRVSLDVLKRLDKQPDGKLVLLTGLLVEDRISILLQLTDALWRNLKVNALACVEPSSLRHHSAIRGGADGGGTSHTPTTEFSLQPSGDSETVSTASGIITDAIAGYGPQQLALSEKDLRSLENEIMAVVALSCSEEDLKFRLSRMMVAESRTGEPVTTENLGICGVLTRLLSNILKPCLIQNLEGAPVFLHPGPLADVPPALSVTATRTALKLVGPQGFVVTETTHAGMERFLGITCRSSRLQPHVLVIVATVRELQMDRGESRNLKLLEEGCVHLKRRVEEARAYGLPVIVAVSTSSSDSQDELRRLCNQAKQAGAFEAVQCTRRSPGGSGALDLAHSVQRAAEIPSSLHFLYDLEMPMMEKIKRVIQKNYGVEDVKLSPKAMEKLERYIQQGFGNFPVCVSETEFPVNTDPTVRRVPSDFPLTVTDIRVHAGARILSLVLDTVTDIIMPSVFDPRITLHVGDAEILTVEV